MAELTREEFTSVNRENEERADRRSDAQIDAIKEIGSIC